MWLKILFSRNAKPGIFGLDMAPKDNFLVYSTKFIILIIRFTPGNVHMVAINMCGEKARHGEVDTLNYVKTYPFTFIFFVYLFIC